MDLSAYKVLHILGLVLIFSSVGGLTLHALNGGSREDNQGRKLVGISHGIGLLLMLISGFGMIAKLGVGFPLWVWLKLGIWLVLGAVTALIRRFAGQAAALWFLLPLLAAVAAYLALYKPGA